MLPVHAVPAGFSLSSFLALPPQPLTRDWYGSPPPAAVSIVLAQSQEELFFGGSVEAPLCCDLSPGCGQFVEGLWTQDVLELFWKPSGSSGYQELNLAPTGAWWWCPFRGYRQRQDGAPAPTARAHAVRHGDRWSAAVALSRAPLGGVDLGAATLNVCAILGDPRRFYTYRGPATAEPDFHAIIAGA
jgi:hypothetical protein